MLPGIEILPDTAVIMRRITSDDPDCTKKIPAFPSRLRTTSFAIRVRGDEEGPSYSWIRITSPSDFIQKGAIEFKLDASRIGVAVLRVSDVRKLKLDVIHCPESSDQGHCEIRPGGKPFDDKVWSRLAKKTLVLTKDEVNSFRSESDVLALIDSVHGRTN